MASVRKKSPKRRFARPQARARTGARPHHVVAPSPQGFDEWYACSLMFTRAMPEHVAAKDGLYGLRGIRNEWPVVFNINDREAAAVFTFFFEKGEPIRHEVTIAPRTPVVACPQDQHAMPGLPETTLMGVRVTSDLPVVVQYSYSQRTRQVPDAEYWMFCAGSRIGYQGPLGVKETRWLHADGHIARAGNFVDTDWYMVLNPDPARAATVDIRMFWPGKELRTSMSVPPQRVSVFRSDTVEGYLSGITYSTIFTSTTPVVVEGVRYYAYDDGTYTAIYNWTARSLPVGDCHFPGSLLP
jgi:hypothetical protein